MGRISRSWESGKFKSCHTDMESRALSLAEEGTFTHPLGKGKGYGERGLPVIHGWLSPRNVNGPSELGLQLAVGCRSWQPCSSVLGGKLHVSQGLMFSAVLLCTASSALLILASPVLGPIGGIIRISFIRCKLWLGELTYPKENSEVRRQWGKTPQNSKYCI